MKAIFRRYKRVHSILLYSICALFLYILISTFIYLIQQSIHPYTFIPFLVLLFIFIAFIYFFVPETKGLTIAEVNRKLRPGYNNDMDGDTEGNNDRQVNTPLLNDTD